MNKKISYILFLAILASLVSLYWYRHNIAAPSELPGRSVSVTVEKGEAVKEISEKLYRNGLIRSKVFFEFYVRRSRANLQAGDFVLNTNQNIKDIVLDLATGRTSSKKLLIREGEDLEEIAALLEKEGMFSKDEFFKATGRPLVDYRVTGDVGPLPPDLSGKYSFLSAKPKYYGLEGYLFPDTYLFARNTTPEQVVDKLLANFDNKLTPQMRQDAAAKGRTIYEVVTMASILEKEVRTAEDMKIAAGIFWHRLANGQRLQSDATLSYALRDGNAAHSGRDLELDSPYNSYRNGGLPPTPISNPGLNALVAAIYPIETDYNFFLTTKDDGRTIFSKTFEEHKLNKAKYLR